MLTFIAQIVATVFAIIGFIEKDFSFYPYIALVFLVCDILGFITGQLKSLGIGSTLIWCAIFCLILNAFNIYAISVAFVAKQVLFILGSLVMMICAAVISIIMAVFKKD